MSPDTVMTYGFSGVVIAVFVSGVMVVIWLKNQLSTERKSTMEAVKAALDPIAADVENVARDQAEELKALRAWIDSLQDDLHKHELYSERQFMSKQTGQVIIEGLRADFKEMRGELVGRLMRIEGQTKALS